MNVEMMSGWYEGDDGPHISLVLKNNNFLIIFVNHILHKTLLKDFVKNLMFNQF